MNSPDNPESLISESMITPKSLAESDVYGAMFRGRMPPRNQAGLPRPSAEDIEVVKQWIQAGASKFPEIPKREFLPLVDVMSSMFTHYQKLAPVQRSHYRYFTLANLWNDGNVDERQLRMTRAALAKALNSLSWQMQKTVAADSDSFMRSVTRVLKPHLLEEDFTAVGDGFPTEPVGEVARWYLLQQMSLETVASELYHPNVDTLRVLIKSDARARQIGIGQLKNYSGTIKREAWHNIEGRSLMQQAADVLGYAPVQ